MTMALVEPPPLVLLHHNINTCTTLFPMEVTAAGTETDTEKSQAPAAQGEGEKAGESKEEKDAGNGKEGAAPPPGGEEAAENDATGGGGAPEESNDGEEEEDDDDDGGEEDDQEDEDQEDGVADEDDEEEDDDEDDDEEDDEGAAQPPASKNGDDGTRLKDGSLLSVQQKVSWQRQETKYLREISLWNRSFDAIVSLLAQTAFTIYGRIRSVFGVPQLDSFAVNQLSTNLDSFPRSRSVSALASGPYPTEKKEVRFCSGPLERVPMELNPGRRLGPVLNRLGSNRVWQDRDRHTIVGSVKSFVSENKGLMTWGSSSPARPSKQFVTNGTDQLTSQNSSNVESTVGCMTTSVSGNADKSDYQTPMAVNGFHSASTSGDAFLPHSGQLKTSPFNGTKCKLLNAPPSTLGGAALALHYANVIIVIEKLVQYPHLIGPDARDDLYQMLPTSLRTALRARLKSYAKNMASTRYNGALAANWNDALGRILEWLAPLAHNMIRWQTERNFEQQHLVPRTNVLLLQTLYFANQVKTELAITELLVGLNYICRYEQEIRSNGHMECANSHDYDEYLEWQL